MDNNNQAFYELLRAGLWEKGARLSQFKSINYATILQLAEKQSVVGLIAAGLEHVADVKVPKGDVLQIVGQALQLEQRNRVMNEFVALLIEKLRREDVYTILVKGQGIAQCYERPLWRASGDVDLLLSDSNYEKAKKVLIPTAEEIEGEYKDYKHFSMTMPGGFMVELHGTLHSHLSRRIDKSIDEIQRDVFYGGNVRSWQNNHTTIFLPAPNNDVIFVFTHILQHFFQGGIGLRQICDWCRLLWTYHDEIDNTLLQKRLQKMGLIPQWQVFAALAVDILGMPIWAMPLYSANKKWTRKAEIILKLVLESGNFGHGRDMSYKRKYPKVIEFLVSFWVYSKYSIMQFKIFPKDALKGWGRTIRLGVKAKLNS